MEISVKSFTIAVQNIELLPKRGWLVGALSSASVPRSPLAPWIETKVAVNKLIRDGTLAAAAPPFFGPLLGQSRFFGEAPEDIDAQFLSVHGDDPQAIRQFIRTYGIFRMTDLHDNKDRPKNEKMPKEVLQLWKEIESGGNRPFALPISEFQYEMERIGGFQAVASILQSKSVKQAREVLQWFERFDVIEDFEKNWDTFASDPLYYIQKLLGVVLASGLRHAAVSPIEVAGEMVPCVATVGILDSVYLRLLERITSGNPLRRCKNIRCGKTFIPRGDQRYCSRDCQNLAGSYRQKGRSIDRQDDVLSAFRIHAFQKDSRVRKYRVVKEN